MGLKGGISYSKRAKTRDHFGLKGGRLARYFRPRWACPTPCVSDQNMAQTALLFCRRSVRCSTVYYYSSSLIGCYRKLAQYAYALWGVTQKIKIEAQFRAWVGLAE